jgi:hypothetical protein
LSGVRAGFAAVVLASLVAAAAGAARGQEPRCHWDTAARASVRSIERGAHYGACVRARGRYDGFAVTVSRRTRTVVTEEVMVGAYLDEALPDAMRQASYDRPRTVEFLARVGDCADICAGPAEPDTICMPVGYCHYHGGAFVRIEAMR